MCAGMAAKPACEYVCVFSTSAAREPVCAVRASNCKPQLSQRLLASARSLSLSCWRKQSATRTFRDRNAGDPEGEA